MIGAVFQISYSGIFRHGRLINSLATVSSRVWAQSHVWVARLFNRIG